MILKEERMQKEIWFPSFLLISAIFLEPVYINVGFALKLYMMIVAVFFFTLH